ncbi:hypothetical protein K435DRAFT_361704 [Dendrothele bispora CBS 962.96]|uniref:Uncharacterized protein n=1 Tax=Dendrothele bispora (strain CBS 962.96) TaxID=1314807 RepID=A0A4S8MHT3_DENBC|nr:hypothetical protein K435DRAFT_361704 [Dendrothele bispora CBS 962.96]
MSNSQESYAMPSIPATTYHSPIVKQHSPIAEQPMASSSTTATPRSHRHDEQTEEGPMRLRGGCFPLPVRLFFLLSFSLGFRSRIAPLVY